ncbi:MAG: DUF4422 domain-containing protein [Subdoligranulum sp.]|nr:DUF4422 domain-containing protein [Subdoligranulum sp.]
MALQQNPDIKIFTSYHKKCKLLSSNYIYPIQVGTSINGIVYPDTLHDDDGDNISDKNRMYCELTAQYWAWKNADADYYGFMHYRRYFSFNPASLREDSYGNILFNSPNKEAFDTLQVDDASISELVSQYDVLCTTPQLISNLNQGRTVWEHYKKSPHHRIEDMQTVLDIIKEKYPDYSSAAQKYMNSKYAYFCNMYILRKDIFQNYSEWLFGILQEHEKLTDFSDYDIDEYRVSGFLAERLWGIYYTWLKENHPELRFKELQRSFFKNTDEASNISKVFSEHDIPIVLSANDAYVPYVTVLLKSLFENADKTYNYDVIILTSDITSEHQQSLTSQFANDKVSLRFFNVSNLIDGRSLFIHRHFTVEIYYRLLIQDIMTDYNKVLYLDSDMVILDDISKLYNTDIGNNFIAAVVDADFAGCYKGVDPDRKDYFDKTLRMNSPYHYFNSGVLIMNLNQFRKHLTTDYIFNLAESKKFLFPDQDILNIVCEGHVFYLDMSWNVMMNWKDNNSCRLNTVRLAPHDMYEAYMESRKHPKIAHYAGFQKPWNKFDCDYSIYFWHYARKTPIYEQLFSSAGSHSSDSVSLIRSHSDSPYQIQIPGMDEPLYIEGFYIKLINKLNKMFPLGSKRRTFIKRIARLFVS